MKPLCMISLAAALALSFSAVAVAQESSPGKDGMTEKPASMPQNNSGTAPSGAGSTGWTGGTGGSFIGTDHQGTNASPNDQPAVASGVDLKGPPVQNQPGKTPE
jgi:hypothetical protein